MASGGAVTLPVPVVTGILLESTASSNPQGSGAVLLRAPVVAGAGVALPVAAGEITLPVLVVAGTGLTALEGAGVVTLPGIVGAGHGLTSNPGVGAVTPPAVIVRGTGPNTGAVQLPAPVVSGEGFTGVAGTGAVRLPVPQVLGEGRTPFAGEGQIVLPAPLLTGAGTTGVVGRAALTLPGIVVAAAGSTGLVGRGQIVLPAPHVQGSGYMSAIGTGAVVLPPWRVEGLGITSDITPALPDGVVFPALVMHTETGSLTQYANYPFNSFATFNGVYLGASAEGLFTLEGETDNGAKIPAFARVGITDFGTSYLKRVDRCYVGYRTDGNLVLRVYTDEVTQRDYLLRATGKDGLHGNHARIGRGLRARYWQFEVQNQNGANFELNAIELKPTHLRRRVGGGDA